MYESPDFLWNLFALGMFHNSTQKMSAPKNMTAKRTKSQVDQQIDENLKRVYDDVLKEAVPDRFLDLIAQLKGTNPDAAHDATSDPKDSNDD